MFSSAFNVNNGEVETHPWKQAHGHVTVVESSVHKCLSQKEHTQLQNDLSKKHPA